MSDERAADLESADLTNPPIPPTGSGVADLEIAYEQMRLAEEAEASSPATDDADLPESEAHPI